MIDVESICLPAPFIEVFVTKGDGAAAFKVTIPGVTHESHQPESKEVKRFTPEPGKEIDLNDMVVEPNK